MVKLFVKHAGKVLSVFIIIILTGCNTERTDIIKLEDGFIDPPIENRPLAFWDWLNGFVDTSMMVYELEEMKDKGMQGAFIWDVGALIDPEQKIPAGPAFLGKESLGHISLALKTGDRLGLNLGMIASSSWNAGGDWIDDADASKQLLSTNQVVTGPSKKTIVVKKPVSRRGEPDVYSLIASIAIPYSESKEIDHNSDRSIPLDEFTSEELIIEWEVPEGKWDIISFFMCNTGQNLEVPSPNSNGFMIDHLSKRATRIHFDTILTRLARVSTAENKLKFLEVDSYEVWPAKDWTPGFIEEFKSRYGYNPVSLLPLLHGYSCKDSLVAQRFRGDYNRLVSDMIIENHFGQSVELANNNGMQMFAEAGHGGYPRVDPLKAFGNTDVPMGEFWNRQRFWVTKEAASAAHIYGKTQVASESLTGWNHWQHGPADFKQLCDIAFCEGLNQIFFHTFAHNPEIAGKPGFAYHAGEHINVNTTWWELVRPFMDYLSRCSFMLRQGNFVGDACLYYGDQAPNLVPSKRIDPNITPIFSDKQCLHCGKPKPVDAGKLPGYDYDYINADIITTTLTVDNGKLALPSGQSYRVMLLPDREDISLEVLKSLEKLVYEGAVVIGRRPVRTTSMKNYPDCDTEVRTLADKMWGECDGEKIFSSNYGKGKVYWGRSVEEVLEELNVPPDFQVKGVDNCDRHIDYIHRCTGSEDIYFVSNSNPEEEKVNCIFRVDENMVPEIWDAETGLIQRKVEYSKVENGISIEFVMDPLASRFIIFRNESTAEDDEGLYYNLQYGFSHQHKADNTNAIDISGNWEMSFDTEMGGSDSYQLEKLISWSDIDIEGIKYYSGKASYTRDFSVSGDTFDKGTEAFVVFEDIQEMAQVFVNGEDCSIVWTPPYKARITPYLKSGNNKITVHVINNWNNRIVGDLKNPERKPFTSTNVKSKFNENSPLLKSGLMGKAEILFSN